jgi:hypothetical protein
MRRRSTEAEVLILVCTPVDLGSFHFFDLFLNSIVSRNWSVLLFAT